MVSVIFAVLEVSFWALTTVVKLLWKFFYINIDQNLQLHVINTFQFTNSFCTTKQHHCKHDVPWPAARGSALKIDTTKMARSFSRKLSSSSPVKWLKNVDLWAVGHAAGLSVTCIFVVFIDQYCWYYASVCVLQTVISSVLRRRQSCWCFSYSNLFCLDSSLQSCASLSCPPLRPITLYAYRTWFVILTFTDSYLL